jgi:hypothetical protein
MLQQTKTGLKVTAKLDDTEYKTGIKISDVMILIIFEILQYKNATRCISNCRFCSFRRNESLGRKENVLAVVGIPLGMHP